MIIVSGTIQLQPGQGPAFLAASMPAMVAARRASGCGAFVVAPDPIQPDLVNVYEEWDTEDSLRSFRGDGPASDLRALIAEAHVRLHQVAQSGPA